MLSLIRVVGACRHRSSGVAAFARGLSPEAIIREREHCHGNQFNRHDRVASDAVAPEIGHASVLPKHSYARPRAPFHGVARLPRLGFHEPAQSAPAGFDVRGTDLGPEVLSCRGFINEIVLVEESDEYQGRVISHFEIYLNAMDRLKADTRAIRRLVFAIRRKRRNLNICRCLAVSPSFRYGQCFVRTPHKSKSPGLRFE
jgi:hypothetical protein